MATGVCINLHCTTSTGSWRRVLCSRCWRQLGKVEATRITGEFFKDGTRPVCTDDSHPTCRDKHH